MNTKQLVVLDVDHTLLHTWHPNESLSVSDILQGLEPFYDDGFDPEQYREKLLSAFSGSFEWQGGVVCPRPFLQEFVSFLIASDVDVAIYSSSSEHNFESTSLR